MANVWPVLWCSTFHTFPYPPSPITVKKLKSFLANFSYLFFKSADSSVMEMSRYDCCFSGLYTLITLANDFFTYYFTFVRAWSSTLEGVFFISNGALGFVYIDTFFTTALFISAILDLGDVLKLFMISFVERVATLLIDCADVADVVDFGLELLIEWVGGLLIYCLFAAGISSFLTMAGFFG